MNIHNPQVSRTTRLTFPLLLWKNGLVPHKHSLLLWALDPSITLALSTGSLTDTLGMTLPIIRNNLFIYRVFLIQLSAFSPVLSPLLLPCCPPHRAVPTPQHTGHICFSTCPFHRALRTWDSPHSLLDGRFWQSLLLQPHPTSLIC